MRGRLIFLLFPRSPLPLERRKPTVSEKSAVAVGADQELAYRPLIAIGRSQSEGGDDPLVEIVLDQLGDQIVPLESK
jgi:hypothetical protein